MRLGIIGWSGHANIGDERMLYCIRRLFEGVDLLVTRSWDNARVRLDSLNSCDFVLIGGGGLILRGANANVDILDSIKPPYGFFGISVEAQNPDMAVFVEVMLQKAAFVIVRDSQSAEYLRNHDKVIIGPDITFLYPFEVSPIVNEDICALNLRPWFYWKAELHGEFHRWMVNFHVKYPRAEIIYPFRKWKPVDVIEKVAKRFSNVVPFPFYFELGVENDVHTLSRFFNECPNSFDEDILMMVKYIIAMRFHALIFSVQCGVPFLSLSYQPKCEVFCRDIGLSQLSLDIFDLDRLPSAIDMLKADYGILRERLLQLRAQYVDEAWAIAKGLKRDLGIT